MDNKPVMCKFADSNNWCKNPDVRLSAKNCSVDPRLDTIRCPFNNSVDVVRNMLKERVFCKCYQEKKAIVYNIVSNSGDIVATFTTADDPYAEQNMEELLKELKNVYKVVICDEGERHG